MRFGCFRGLAIAMLTLASCAFQAEAGVFRHAIPRETPAMNLNTGQPYYAPPIPYGHYVKDPIGCIHGAAGMAAGAVHGMIGKVCSLCKPCGRCGGPGCGSCGGLGLFKGHGCDDCGADGCRSCGGEAGHGHGGGLFHHGGNNGVTMGDPVIMGDPQVVDTGFVGGAHSRGGKHNHAGLCGPGMPCASAQFDPGMAVAGPSSQSYIACGSCHGNGKGCGRCGGRGFFSKLKNCGLCGGHGRLGNGAACGGCAGLGHGCGDPGCSGRGHSLCNSCGGRGCNACNGCGLLHGLLNKSHSLLNKPRSLVSGLIHKHDVQYFVGPGGPVPITPGYVNYVNPVRSPRDFLAFPPYSDIMP